ncbi:hypothetical protein CLOSTASPAR_00713 [[Clostridium] asparagiforme DSM 15981]|uniref:Uncharacterized protein n=1 Tax=[Clostridium] asparagiforme DSM 15981 TaxID=518636 RepID=C0CUM1_9FIRM|nr:hypothetical protein CLOSTASPAR_00713 [[Clostridium] asparagiforme DSM 15981]
MVPKKPGDLEVEAEIRKFGLIFAFLAFDYGRGEWGWKKNGIR